MAGSFIATVVQHSIAVGLGIAGSLESHVNDGGSNVVLGYRGAYRLAICFEWTAFFVVGFFIRDQRFDLKQDAVEKCESTEEPTGDEHTSSAQV